MQSTNNCLNALLTAAGLKEDAFGRKRTAYSFRHTEQLPTFYHGVFRGVMTLVW